MSCCFRTKWLDCVSCVLRLILASTRTLLSVRCSISRVLRSPDRYTCPSCPACAGAPGLLPRRRSLRISIVAVGRRECLACRDRQRWVQRDWRARTKQATTLGVASAAICCALCLIGIGALGAILGLIAIDFFVLALMFKSFE